jgi:hypothetical protein
MFRADYWGPPHGSLGMEVRTADQTWVKRVCLAQPTILNLDLSSGSLPSRVGYTLCFFSCGSHSHHRMKNGLTLIIVTRVFPETLRVLVGNGSIAPSRWNRPPLPLLTKNDVTPTTTLPPRKKFINPFLQFTHPSVVLVLLFNGTLYSVLYSVSVPLSKLFSETYPFLSESQIGLCFLAIGMGSALGSFLNGKMLDADFRRILRRLDIKAATDLEKGAKTKEHKYRAVVVREAGKLDDAFPIEYARVRLIPAYVAVLAVSLVGYGWAMHSRIHMACPLILQLLSESRSVFFFPG